MMQDIRQFDGDGMSERRLTAKTPRTPRNESAEWPVFDPLSVLGDWISCHQSV
jgi:hypothetical protein